MRPQVNVKFNNRGFTLVELLVSIVIALIVFTALAGALMFYTRYNVLNALRNRAVTIAQSCVDSLNVGNECPVEVEYKYRNYVVDFNVEAPDPTKFASGTFNKVKITVSYSYGGNVYSYSINTVVYKQ